VYCDEGEESQLSEKINRKFSLPIIIIISCVFGLDDDDDNDNNNNLPRLHTFCDKLISRIFRDET
jgi:hypothetical protein